MNKLAGAFLAIGVLAAACGDDGNVFITLTDHFQAGYSFQAVEQTFGDNVKAKNYRNEIGLHLHF